MSTFSIYYMNIQKMSFLYREIFNAECNFIYKTRCNNLEAILSFLKGEMYNKNYMVIRFYIKFQLKKLQSILFCFLIIILRLQYNYNIFFLPFPPSKIYSFHISLELCVQFLILLRNTISQQTPGSIDSYTVSAPSSYLSQGFMRIRCRSVCRGVYWD